MSTSMDSIYLSSKCSFCFESFTEDAERIKIDREIHAKFNELVKRKLLSKKFAPNICIECYNKLTLSYDFKIQLEANQKLLEMSLNISNETTTTENYSTVKFIKEEPQEFMITKFFEEIPPKPKKDPNQKKICPYCAKHYAPGALENHIKKSHTEDYKYFCDHCPLKFKTRKDICGHMEIHMSPESRRRFQCEYCERNYSKKTSLLHHIQMWHTENGEIFECECGASFKTQKRLRYHKRNTHEQGSYECHECNKFYKSKHLLKTHIAMIHRDKIPCTICGKEVAEGHLMKDHMKRHLSANHICKTCGEKFSTREGLLKHEREIHFLVKGLHFCKDCGKELSSARALKRHILRLHTETEKVKCCVEECKYETGQKDDLVKHLKTQHKELSEEKLQKKIVRIKSMRNWNIKLK
ncbi:hypothetical protein PVAND_015288 [Polypedilum vanderplanki]|uniref:C2H2-type domain-containing protein n=1 Tax=Polypedilum vanderplanki TaxID=319348 RepID=A0A9J6BCK8_POLVA|nr:hypothetical protein PVAND_015288 [Polypedilum vanderplanki]